MSENKNNAPGCNCCQDDHEAVIRNLQELVRNLDSCCNNRGTIIKNQKSEIDKLRESNRALHEENDKLKRKSEVVRGMQSKIAKQSNEIERLNEMLSENAASSKKLLENYASLIHDHQEAMAVAKDNFMQGCHRGMDELWAAIQKLQDMSPSARADICGYRDMRDCVSNLSAQNFAKKVNEWEEKEAHDIKIGDEVINISPFGSDDSECFIVYSIKEKANGAIVYRSIGPGDSLSFSIEAIADGSVRKTGRRYDSIPFDYID